MKYIYQTKQNNVVELIIAMVFFVFFFGMFAISFAAWLTHIIICLSQGLWGFLIAGAIFFPIGIIHGIGIWFGVW